MVSSLAILGTMSAGAAVVGGFSYLLIERGLEYKARQKLRERLGSLSRQAP